MSILSFSTKSLIPFHPFRRSNLPALKISFPSSFFHSPLLSSSSAFFLPPRFSSPTGMRSDLAYSTNGHDFNTERRPWCIQVPAVQWIPASCSDDSDLGESLDTVVEDRLVASQIQFLRSLQFSSPMGMGSDFGVVHQRVILAIEEAIPVMALAGFIVPSEYKYISKEVLPKDQFSVTEYFSASRR